MPTVSILVGTRKGGFVLESDSTRREWAVRGPFLKGWEVADVTVEDSATDRLLAAVNHFVYGPTIQISDDLGETWEQAEESPTYPNPGPSMEKVWTIEAVSRDGSDVLYAGVAEAGLFVSRDHGRTWTDLPGLSDHPTRDQWVGGMGGLCCHSICTDPDDPDRLWVGISAVGVFRTDDGGTTWTLKNDGLALIEPEAEGNQVGSCVHALVNDPTDPSRLFQQNHLGVFRSTNGAESWERIDDDLPTTFGFPIVLHPRESDTLYSFPLESDEYRMADGGKMAVYRTRDAGDSWERCAAGLPDRSWSTVLRQAMSVDSLDPAGVYLGTTGGQLWYSRDDGETWEDIDCRLPRIQSVEALVLE